MKQRGRGQAGEHSQSPAPDWGTATVTLASRPTEGGRAVRRASVTHTCKHLGRKTHSASIRKRSGVGTEEKVRPTNMSSDNHDLSKSRISLNLGSRHEWLKPCALCSCCKNSLRIYRKHSVPASEENRSTNLSSFPALCTFLPQCLATPVPVESPKDGWIDRWMDGRTTGLVAEL